MDTSDFIALRDAIAAAMALADTANQDLIAALLQQAFDLLKVA